MRNAATERDQAVELIRLVRRGKIDQLHPDLFSDELPKSIAKNSIDQMARDTAAVLAPLPSLACASGNMTSAADEKRASTKNKIGKSYWDTSAIAVQNVNFADSWLSYSFGIYDIEPDFVNCRPVIRYESPFGAYYHKDRWGNVVRFAKIQQVRVGQLCDLFPEYGALIRNRENGQPRGHHELVELVKYKDLARTVVYLPECRNLVLASAKNPISRLSVVIAERPDQEMSPRGQYDDVVYPMLARSIMAQNMLRAANQAVEAPWAMPDDVTTVSIGPDAILRSQQPEKIGRVPLNIPRDVFALADQLERDVNEGGGYPEVRMGAPDANIITGKGVQALQGTMQTQVNLAQTVFAPALEAATSICFEMDAALWPNKKKKITGFLTGKPFELTYTPSRDIGDSFDCKVTYGFSAGMTPAQSVVMMLQLRGDNVISRDNFRRQLPFEIDPEEEQRSVDKEQMEDALKQGFSALLQAMGPMVMQGGDPLKLISSAAKAIQLRQKGTPLADAIAEAMTPPEQEQAPPEPEAPPAPGPEGAAPELPPGIRENGLSQGVAYGQQGMAPGGMPAIQSLIAGLRGPSGEPRMSAETMRKRPTGMG